MEATVGYSATSAYLNSSSSNDYRRPGDAFLHCILCKDQTIIIGKSIYIKS